MFSTNHFSELTSIGIIPRADKHILDINIILNLLIEMHVYLVILDFILARLISKLIWCRVSFVS